MHRRIYDCLLFFVLMLIPVFAQAQTISAPVVSGKTDVGVVRDHNEDSIIMFDDAKVYVVADGMGGHAAGEVASEMAVNTVNDFVHVPVFGYLDKVWPMSRTMIVFFSYFEGNKRILKESIDNPARRGMGTTMVSLVLRKDYADVINLGDSRAYLIRNQKIVQISHDHSLWQELIDRGVLKTPEEIENYPHKNIITQAMGTRPELAPDIFTVPVQPGDIYILCSDGLTNELTDNQIMQIILSHGNDLDAATTDLVQKARILGGRDNISVILVKP